MPAYRVPWMDLHEFEQVHVGNAHLGADWFTFTIRKEKNDTLGFPLYVVDIPGRFDRSGIYLDPESGYGYWDEFERYASFQISVLEWISRFDLKPDVLHCHDHHTALIPFMTSSCPEYQNLIQIATVLTVHNGEYHGWYDYSKRFLLPYVHPDRIGLLEWSGRLNTLSAGIRTCWALTTVSPTYMHELRQSSAGLETLFRAESSKSQGILNGIDVQVWDPQADPLVEHHYSVDSVSDGKRLNKEVLCHYFNLDASRPTFAFIGRLVREKGADLLPETITEFLEQGNMANFIVLGTGEPWLHHKFREMSRSHIGYFDASIQYNEKLAHQIYAGTDFLLMPSRVEPCGLNQLYSLRYGTIPVVRAIGGLSDTVVDMGDEGGYGIRFIQYSQDDLLHALNRAMKLFNDTKRMAVLREKAMLLDFSWETSATAYINLYKKLAQY